MKVALINPPYTHLVLRCGYCSTFSKSDYYWPPLDLVIQSGFLSRSGHDVRFFDFNIAGTGRYDAVREVSSWEPDGVFMLVGSGSWKSDLAFAGELKKLLPRMRVVASGATLLYNSREILQGFPWIDAVLMDFTQDVVGRFLKGERDVPHLSYKGEEEIVVGSPSTWRSFSYPPGRHDLLPLSLYRHPWKSAPFTVLLTSFGCPFSCTFCNTTGVPFKHRPLDEVLEELGKINSLGIHEVMFRDHNFISSVPRTRELCRRMIEEGIQVGWFTCARADMLDDKTLALMKGSGCHTLHIGVESGSKEILGRYQKKVDLSRVEEAFRLCRKHSIRTLAFFILGLPGETEETMRQTMNFSKRLKCDFASFNIATPLYGTRLREECLRKGFIRPGSGLEELETSFQETAIETPYLTGMQIRKGVIRAMRAFYLRPGYVLSRLCGIRSLADIKALWRMGMPVLKRIL